MLTEPLLSRQRSLAPFIDIGTRGSVSERPIHLQPRGDASMNGQLRNTIGLVLAFASAPATAQVADHLECYRLKDSLARTIYTADLSGLAVEPGCTVKVPATLMCVETPKQNVSPTPPGAPSSSAAGRFLCYKVKCAKQTIPAELVTDQFGSRTVQASVSQAAVRAGGALPGGRREGRPRLLVHRRRGRELQHRLRQQGARVRRPDVDLRRERRNDGALRGGPHGPRVLRHAQ